MQLQKISTGSSSLMTEAYISLWGSTLTMYRIHGKLWGWKQSVAMLSLLTSSSIWRGSNVQLFLWTVVCILHVNITY